MKRILMIALAGSVVGLTLLIAVAAGFGVREAASPPIRRQVAFALADWPQHVRPVKLALLADIHLGNRMMDAERLGAIVRQINATHPDLVLIAGDFVTGHEGVGASRRASQLEAPLSRLRAPLGVVAVLGNHDHWTAPEAIRRSLSRAGVTVLMNQATERGPVSILGVDDAFSGHDDVDRTVASARGMGGIQIVLTHSPDLLHKLRGRFPLVLAGHTHCGQLVLQGLGPLPRRSPREGWKPLYDPRYRCGMIRDRDRAVVVTAGLGSGTIPMRLGAPPDWWLIRLGPTDD